MKTIALVIASLVCGLCFGFFSGYLVTRPDTSQPLNSTRVEKNIANDKAFPVQPILLDTSGQLINYEDIEAQSTIFGKLKLAHDLADRASIEQLTTYILRAAPSRDPFYGYNLVSVFLEKFTSLDPEAAIRLVEAHDSLSNQRFISHVVTSWVRDDPEAAIAYVEGLTNLSLKGALLNRLVIDPTIANSGLLNNLEQSLGPNAIARRQMLQASQQPPAEAFENALLINGQARFGAIHNALLRWVREDADAAISRIQQHPNMEQKNQMLQSILHEYIKVDADAAFEFAKQNLTGTVQMEQHMLMMLAQQDPKRTLPLVEDFIARTGNANPMNGMIASWIQKSPAEALAYIETLDEQRRETMFQSAAFSYVHSHPEEGFDWLLSQVDQYPRLVENTIGSSINNATVDYAERAMSRINNEEIRTRLLVGIGNFKATQDPEGALRWVEGFQRDPAYPTAVQNVISAISHQNPKRAADALEAHLDEDYASPLISQIAASWYQGNPRDSMRWLTSLPEGDAKLGALSSIVSSVAHQDPEAAVDLLDEIPAGPHRTNAARNLAYARLARDPQDIDSILEDLDITGEEANQLRAMARQRSPFAAGRLRP